MTNIPDKTIEEIFDEYVDEDLKHSFPNTTKCMMDAMGQFASQESRKKAIGFAEWAAKNGWYLNKICRWSNRGESSANLIEVLSSTKTTTELYDLYLQEQNKSK